MTALDEDTWDVSKLVLDAAAEPYQSALSAVFLASATTYRPPAVLSAIVGDAGSPATDGDPGGAVELARHSLALDPLAPVVDAPVGPEGFAFDDPEDLMVWWGMGALTPWQTVVESTDEMTRYDLWDTELFSPFEPFEPIVKSSTPGTIRGLARSLAPQLNVGLLSEANTYTWRGAGRCSRPRRTSARVRRASSTTSGRRRSRPTPRCSRPTPAPPPSPASRGTRTARTGPATHRCPGARSSGT